MRPQQIRNLYKCIEEITAFIDYTTSTEEKRAQASNALRYIERYIDKEVLKSAKEGMKKDAS